MVDCVQGLDFESKEEGIAVTNKELYKIFVNAHVVVEPLSNDAECNSALCGKKLPRGSEAVLVPITNPCSHDALGMEGSQLCYVFCSEECRLRKKNELANLAQVI